MSLKICKGKGENKGCGELKPLSDFRTTRRWHENVCRECRKKHKREKYRIDVNLRKLALHTAWK